MIATLFTVATGVATTTVLALTVPNGGAAVVAGMFFSMLAATAYGYSLEKRGLLR